MCCCNCDDFDEFKDIDNMSPKEVLEILASKINTMSMSDKFSELERTKGVFVAIYSLTKELHNQLYTYMNHFSKDEDISKEYTILTKALYEITQLMLNRDKALGGFK